MVHICNLDKHVNTVHMKVRALITFFYKYLFQVYLCLATFKVETVRNKKTKTEITNKV